MTSSYMYSLNQLNDDYHKHLLFSAQAWLDCRENAAKQAEEFWKGKR